MESTHECGTSLNNRATLVQFKLAELRSDKPCFCSFNWHGLTWYKLRVTTFYSWSLPEVSAMPNIRQWL